MPWIEIYRRGRREQEIEIPERGVTIGRDADVDVVLADTIVSRRHARLFPAGGRWVIEDLETRNGTWVNGLREFRRPLIDGDQIEIGPFILTFRRHEREPVPGTDPALKNKRSAGTPTLERPLVYDPKKDPDSTQRLDPKTMARVREEARALMGPHLLQVIPSSAAHPLRRRENVIGAASDAHLSLPEIGRDEAALVEVSESGECRLKKLGWFTSVRVNGQRVSEIVLQDGDELQLGPVRFVFVSGAR